MKKATVLATLIENGIRPEQIVERFTEAGLQIGVRVRSNTGREGLVFGLVPIDDESDVAFARGLAQRARTEVRQVVHLNDDDCIPCAFSPGKMSDLLDEDGNR